MQKLHKNHLHLHLIHVKSIRSEKTTNFPGVFAFTVWDIFDYYQKFVVHKIC